MAISELQKLKQILNNSERNTLIALLPHLNNKEADELERLAERLRKLDEKIKQKQSASRSLSHLIGETKRNGNDVDTLLPDMQTISSELKALNKKRQTLESKLLGYIQSTDAANNKTQYPKPPQGRQYKDKDFDNGIQISELQDDPTAWNQYVQKQHAASIYHLAQWRDIIRDLFGHESHYFYAHNNAGIIKGILPLIRLKSRLFGDFMVSMPYFNYGGAIADHPATEKALIQHANQQAHHLGLQHIEYREDIIRTGYPVRTDKVNMILPLPGDEDTLWQSFSTKVRSQIRRPQREDILVKRGKQELLDDFYRVFARNMRDLGTPVYSKALFATILHTFPKNAYILIVYLSDKPVAGAFLIGYKDTLEIPWASAIRDVNHLSINMLMYWEILRFAISERYKFFDFGRSSLNSGTYKFKKQWGAQPKQLYWHYWLNNCEMPSLNPANPKYKLMINIWKKMPICLANSIGPWIVKNLP